MQDITSYHIQSFYGWWQLATCFFAFLALMSIWYHIGKKQGDYGQIWLGLSILCWSILGGVEVYFANRGLNQSATINYSTLGGYRSILSLLNSLFILIALPWFRYLPSILKPIIKSKYWIIIVGLPFLFSLLPTISRMVTGQQSELMSELDVYYSILTLIILGIVLWESFTKRRLQWLAYLSIVCVMIVFAAQIYKLSGTPTNQILLSAIFKTSLIMIFFALALSWVKDLSEMLLVQPQSIYLKLQRQKDNNDQQTHLVHIKGLAHNEYKKIQLSSNQYELLRAFADHKSNGGDGWLNIKPKSETRSGKQYDIRDYNEIKRLVVALLDGYFGKSSWSKTQHYKPLQEGFFEFSNNRDGKIRLRIPSDNIHLM